MTPKAIVRKSASIIRRIGKLMDEHAALEDQAEIQRVPVHGMIGIMCHDGNDGGFYCVDTDEPYTAENKPGIPE